MTIKCGSVKSGDKKFRRLEDFLQPVLTLYLFLKRKLYNLEDYLVHYFELYSVPFAYISFGLIFFYFGLQKPLTVRSPVNSSVSIFLGTVGLPTYMQIPFSFIGFYEMLLGVLFFFRRLRLAFILFIPHQLITLLSILVTPYNSFQPPWLNLLGLKIPWVLDWFSAFVLKNLVFISAFMMLAAIELGSGNKE